MILTKKEKVMYKSQFTIEECEVYGTDEVPRRNGNNLSKGTQEAKNQNKMK